MEAIFRDGGRQYKVTPGTVIDVDYRDIEAGSRLEFGDVVYLGREGSEPVLGRPTVPGAKVIGEVVGVARGPKLVVAYLRRRKNSRRRVGHRQDYTRVRIQSIET